MDTLRDYYKKQFEIESVRRQVLNSAVAMPLAIISIVLGGLSLVAKAIQWPLVGSAVLQLVCIAIAGFFVLAASYFAARSFYGFAYWHMPTPLEIKVHHERLAEYYARSLPSGRANETAERETLEYLDKVTAEYADVNTKVNDRKSYYLHRSNGACLLAVAALTVSAGPYVADSLLVSTPPQKIEITNLKEVTMQLQRQANQPSTDQKPVQAPAQTPATTEKPSPPPGRLIKEDTDPNKKTR